MLFRLPHCSATFAITNICDEPGHLLSPGVNAAGEGMIESNLVHTNNLISINLLPPRLTDHACSHNPREYIKPIPSLSSPPYVRPTPISTFSILKVAMPSCPDCGQSKYKNYREASCSKCRGRYNGHYIRDTAKDCNDSNCNGGAKRSDPAKDCNACQGTGKKLTRCDENGCINGFFRVYCYDEFHSTWEERRAMK
ncbi:hypothetical protein F5Y10DRAFT_150950 [Nemania abortiva]|nr:hypothetical protein F5Y10DRAFT_150950 [Nemania abortiva]